MSCESPFSPVNDSELPTLMPIPQEPKIRPPDPIDTEPPDKGSLFVPPSPLSTKRPSPPQSPLRSADLIYEDDVLGPQDMLADEELFTANPQHIASSLLPSPLPLSGGLCGYQPPIPQNTHCPVYRRCLVRPEMHASDGVWDGNAWQGTRGEDIPTTMIWARPGMTPPAEVAEFWERLLSMVDIGQQQPDPAWMSKSRFTHAGWEQYDDNVMRGQDDMYKIRDGRGNASRDIFALGGLIIKSNHRRIGDKEDPLEWKYERDDSREVNVRALIHRYAPLVAQHMPPPRLYFAGLLKGKNVLVLERIKGTSVGRLIPRIKSHELEWIREILRAAISLLMIPAANNPGVFLMHNELLPHNVFMKFGTVDIYGHQSIKYTLDPHEPLPTNLGLAGLIDWKELVWAEPQSCIGKHQLTFMGGWPGAELELRENASEAEKKTKIWHDLYAGLSDGT
ncbi:hypothetical protein EJ05DRAFT_504324 [Pseudovirgaria hyperparasitica]|uniref:Protein kinase domain-containing protein n=1 Tax=Pseudovirgaria hyperparasitica TaxID=470096 RepID=A0A6A6VWY5_9PEZI|nr:uncharacterized protein EJ05DRAFT_504324 [Pseudovirgaria hyperparasitica]KAF2754224.1 hypothetical protein EJ05DRAFT_504324 [Pseudovirgaria hyperparasitica]